MDGESIKPADVKSGMIMEVLKSSPMKVRQSAIYDAGMNPEYPECQVLAINQIDFNYFAHEMLSHNLRISKIKTMDNGNELYAIEEGHPLILR